MDVALLSGFTVVEFGGEPAARAGRALADLGATVVRIEIDGCPDAMRSRAADWIAWTYGKQIVAVADLQAAAELARNADVVLDTPFDADTIVIDPAVAPSTHWVHITPFGMEGPRARWHATDLGIMASTGNMFCTGDADRPPVRASEATSYAHVGGEAAFAAITALVSKHHQIIDVSIQECVLVANMGGAGRFFRTGARGQRSGAQLGRTREIWPTLDGFVSFGIRGGSARAASMKTIAELVEAAGIDAGSLQCDWKTWSHTTAEDVQLDAMQAAIGALFAQRSMTELYEIAVATNLMLAPANSPREVFASEQLAAREFLTTNSDGVTLPKSFVQIQAGPEIPNESRQHDVRSSRTGSSQGEGAWSGYNILEFGSGAAGPIATRYFAEHGATVLRIESVSRPDFLRAMALASQSPHGLEGSDLFDALNCGKRSLTLNLKLPESIAIVHQLVVEWADAICENYAPKAMRGFGLDYPTLAAMKPDLVMMSACLNGQTGPHKDYPGFGGQGSALSGWNSLTGWPDREPVGPFGTITDSLAPRYVAAALAAALVYRDRTGQGAYLDVSQVETGLYALSPWLIEYSLDGTIGKRYGNRSPRSCPHGAFPSAPTADGRNDRWIAIACHTDAQWQSLCEELGLSEYRDFDYGQRRDAIDLIEAAVADATTARDADALADQLQARGIEAVPVADLGDVFHNPQLEFRNHFVELTHPRLGAGRYEANGTRTNTTSTSYWRAAPLLGEDSRWALRELAHRSDAEIDHLIEIGAVEVTENSSN